MTKWTKVDNMSGKVGKQHAQNQHDASARYMVNGILFIQMGMNMDYAV